MTTYSPSPKFSKVITCNSFQRSMWQWDELRPYNAVHAALLPRPFDAAELRQAIQSVFHHRGIGSVKLGRSAKTMQFFGLPDSFPVRVLPGAADPILALQMEMEAAINRTFRSGNSPFLAFQFFVQPVGDQYWLGITYFHAVADASAITSLMSQIAHKLAAPETELPPQKNPTVNPNYDLWSWFKRLPGHIACTRQLLAPTLHEERDDSNGLLFSQLGPGRWCALKAAAKAWEIKVNDIFLAALLLSQEPLAPDRHKPGAKSKLAATCVVSGRAPNDDSFGLQLGLFRVSHEVPPGITLENLARDLHRQINHLKRTRDALALGHDLCLSRALHRVFPLDSHGKFYHKYNPSWGGVTNMNLERLTCGISPEQPVDYWRAVSTGPVTPTVLSLTSAAGGLRIAFSYRTAVYSHATAKFLHHRLHSLLCLS